MKPLSQTLKKMLSALAAADAGEMLGRRAKHRHLSAYPTQPGPVAAAPAEPIAPPKRKQVALWLHDMPTQAALNYALSSCQRMEMDLLILHTGKLRAQALLAAHGAAFEAADVPVEIAALEDAGQATLFDYIERHPRIAFLVMGDPSQAMTDQTALPPVPLVVVTSAQDAARTESELQPSQAAAA
ncbi:hypothetical protein EDC61_10527 [Sulfuritortus calidifontis]|uniref:Universal stress protein family protein n=1 Tax=Sulfuritortus calidifontis TaxID=1914471 RepID=A0A4R3JYL7_9PROT|nr:hypothetical protein [Sulfuritortus calidifontis]TCS72373.1 hypothetical protein EDC61_10527 [Sulfuritortus calidifontis]